MYMFVSLLLLPAPWQETSAGYRARKSAVRNTIRMMARTRL